MKRFKISNYRILQQQQPLRDIPKHIQKFQRIFWKASVVQLVVGENLREKFVCVVVVKAHSLELYEIQDFSENASFFT